MKSKVSIITPYYNARDYDLYLEELYNSIQNQNVNWDWIIECNRPMPERQKKMLRGDSRILINDNKHNMGPAIARNRALAHSSAPYVFAVDDDDFIPDGALDKLVEKLDERDNCFGVFGQSVREGIEGNTPHKTWPGVEREILPGEISDKFINGEFVIHAGTILWRREYLDALGGWMALHGSEDTSLVIRASSIWPSYAIKTPSYFYRSFSSSITKSDDFIEETPRRHQFIKKQLESFHKLLSPKNT